MITGRRNTRGHGLMPALVTAAVARPPAWPTLGRNSGCSQTWRAEATPSGLVIPLFPRAKRGTPAIHRLLSSLENSGRARPTAIFYPPVRGHRANGSQTL